MYSVKGWRAKGKGEKQGEINEKWKRRKKREFKRKRQQDIEKDRI